MPHAPQDPVVREAYENLIQQTRAQYDALVAAGYQFWFVDPSSPEGAAYLASPWNAMRDIRENQSMGSYPTDDGFGSGDFNPEANPLLADTGIQWPVGSPDGQAMKPVLANDLFRVVHDAFGHGLEGAGFRARGEENAWQAHVRLFTGSAVGAITSETRGQNSWLNYGPHGERNRTAPVEDTIFADQKTGLMPEWTWTEGRAGDMPAEPRFSLAPPVDSPAFQAWFGDSKVVDAEGKPLVVYHGTQADIDSFNPGMRGSATGAKSAEMGFFFTSNSIVASKYANMRNMDEDGQEMAAYSAKLNRLVSTLDRAEDELVRYGEGGFVLASERERTAMLKDANDRAGAKKAMTEYQAAEAAISNHKIVGGDAVYPVFLSIENPLIHDQKGEHYRDKLFARLMSDAASGGHDGVIIKNTYDSPSFGQELADIYVAFRPEQIKSAIGNVGAYGQRPVTADEAARLGMTRDEANEAQGRGDIRFSLAGNSRAKEGLRKLGLSREDAESLADRIRNMTMTDFREIMGQMGRRSEEGLFDGLNCFQAQPSVTARTQATRCDISAIYGRCA